MEEHNGAAFQAWGSELPEGSSTAMRLNDENPVFIEPGFSATEYIRALIVSFSGFHDELTKAIRESGNEDQPASIALATRFHETSMALKFLLNAFPEEEHESGLASITESFEQSAREARELKGYDWNPEYDPLVLSTEETVFAFFILVARDLRAVLDQIELERIYMGES